MSCVPENRKTVLRCPDAVINKIESVPVDIGARVKAGDTLLTLNSEVLAAPQTSVFSDEGRDFVFKPLAVVVMGGLLTSTVLTLIVLPSLYFLVETRKERITRTAKTR